MSFIAASRWTLLAAFLLFAGVTHPQAACPPGTIPYGTGQGQNVCGPDDSQQQPAQQNQPPPPQWMDRWGAIATAVVQRITGVSTNQPTNAAAKRTALSDCQSKGGLTCKIELSYRNQCIAMVVANGGYSVDLGLTPAAASEKALKDCTDGGLANCHIFYSACSLPIRIQ